MKNEIRLPCSKRLRRIKARKQKHGLEICDCGEESSDKNEDEKAVWRICRKRLSTSKFNRILKKFQT